MSMVTYLELFKTEVDTEEFTGTQTLSEMRKDSLVGTMNEKMKKDVNYVNYPGFRKKELSELPGQLETPQLLHRVTKAQHFNVSQHIRHYEWYDTPDIEPVSMLFMPIAERS